ncbi:MAG TPA: HAMP domain-containing sensor histidine kinase [Longimicrobiales bacterium]|nr:HAMP domain-containing sensor histidine kinase [Longimicrobiales bacterium]
MSFGAPDAPPGTPGGESIAALVQQAKLATLGMLVAGIAHELNTPLGALHGNHDVLQRALHKLHAILEDEVVEPHELDEVRRIVAAVTSIVQVNELAMARMVQLVKDLRNFGRLDRADIDVVDLHEGIRSTIAIMGVHSRTVTIDTEFGVLPAVRCHPDRLNQVWMNLLMNAVHASPAGGRVHVRTHPLDAMVRIEIVDDGAGIPTENLERIFEPGFTTKSGRVGMGLGLAIAREVVQQHGGSIRVASERGVGTTFTIDLPVAGPIADTEPAASHGGAA